MRMGSYFVVHLVQKGETLMIKFNDKLILNMKHGENTWSYWWKIQNKALPDSKKSAMVGTSQAQ